MRLRKAFEVFKLHRRRFVNAAELALAAATQSGLGAASAEPDRMDAVQVKSRMRKEGGAMSFDKDSPPASEGMAPRRA